MSPGTTDRTTSAIVKPNCPARSRSILMSSVGKSAACANCRSRRKSSFAICSPDLLRVCIIVLQTDSLHRDLDRRRRSEAHHLRHDIGRFERHLARRQFSCKTRPQLLAQRFAPRRVGLERHLNDRLLRTAGEQMNQIHRIAGRHHADEIAGDFDIVGADRPAESRPAPGEPSAPSLQCGFPWAPADECASAEHSIRETARFPCAATAPTPARSPPRDKRPPAASGIARSPRDSARKQIEASDSFAFFAAMPFLHQPGRKHRNQAARQQIRRDHRKRHRQRQRNEKLPAHARP